MKPKEYRRLPGRGRRGGFLSLTVTAASCTLWLGRDHLLAVDHQGYREDYKRFYFRDIQAIVTRRTRKASVRSVFLSILVAAFLALTIPAGPIIRIVAGTLAGTTLIFLVVNVLRGPSCVCHLQTAVHTEELPSLNRLRTARKLIERLRPLIEQAQGTVTPEELQNAAALLPAPTAAGAPATLRKQTRPIRHESGRIHLALFLTLILGAGFTFLDLISNDLGITVANMLVALAVGVLVVFALVRQNDSDLPREIRRTVLWSTGYLGLMMIAGYSQFAMIVIDHPGALDNQFDMFRAFAEIPVLDSLWLSTVYAVCILTSLALGMTGLILLQRLRLHRAAQAPAASPPIDG